MVSDPINSALASQSANRKSKAGERKATRPLLFVMGFVRAENNQNFANSLKSNIPRRDIECPGIGSVQAAGAIGHDEIAFRVGFKSVGARQLIN